MIELTRLNGHSLIVNSDLIKLVESSPDTTLTLTNGERLIVLESPEKLLLLIACWRSRVLQLAWPYATSAPSASATHHAIHRVTT